MPQTVPCKFCQYPIRFDEDELGLEVYCDSCGRPQVLEPEPPPAAAAEGDLSHAESPAAEDLVFLSDEDMTDEAPADEAPADEAAAEEAAAEEFAAEEVTAEEAAAAGATAEQAADLPAVSVFSAHGLAQAEQQIVAEETCLCGAKVPVRVEDIGQTVYCPACSTEIQIGRTLVIGKYLAARQVKEDGAERPHVAVRKPRMRLIRSPLAMAAMLLVFAVMLSAGWLTWSRPELVLKVFGPPAGNVVPEDEDLPKKNKKPPEVPTKPAPAKKRPTPPQPQPITLEMIEQLLRQKDLSEALIQAQTWLETLRDQGLGPSDPRWKRLAEVVKALEEKLSPPQGPPPYLAEFRKLVAELEAALKAGETPAHLAAARQALEQAEAFLQEHKQSLSAYCEHFRALKTLLEKREAMLAGVAQVRKWFDEAAAAAAAGKPTLAIETQAKARFLALAVPLTKAEIDELDRKDRQLTLEILFARGKRAVADAKRCQQASDLPTRDRETRRVFAILSGLPESRIKPLLDEVRPWYDAIEKADRDALDKAKSGGNSPPGKRPGLGPGAGKRAAKPSSASSAADPASALADEIDFREAYEALLEPYGRAQCGPLADACRNFQELLGDDEASRKTQTRLEKILFDVLEREIARRLEEAGRIREPEELRKRLSQVRSFLDQAEPWRNSHRWMALDAAIRRQGGRLAEEALQEAASLLKGDRLDEAAKKAAAAEQLGDPAVARRARAIGQKCEAEVKLRTDQRAEAESWQRIQTLKSDSSRDAEFWKELELFSRRYPNSAHLTEIEQMKLAARQAVESKVAGMLQQVAKLLDGEDYVAARKLMELLELAPIPSSQASVYKELQDRLGELKPRAEKEFEGLGVRKRLLSENDVIAVLGVLPRVLAMDPEHEEARSLLEKVRRQAALRAEKLVKEAAPFETTRPEVFRDKLKRAAKLDPDGPHGAKARELLGEGSG